MQTFDGEELFSEVLVVKPADAPAVVARILQVLDAHAQPRARIVASGVGAYLGIALAVRAPARVEDLTLFEPIGIAPAPMRTDDGELDEVTPYDLPDAILHDVHVPVRLKLGTHERATAIAIHAHEALRNVTVMLVPTMLSFRQR